MPGRDRRARRPPPASAVAGRCARRIRAGLAHRRRPRKAQHARAGPLPAELPEALHLGPDPPEGVARDGRHRPGLLPGRHRCAYLLAPAPAHRRGGRGGAPVVGSPRDPAHAAGGVSLHLPARLRRLLDPCPGAFAPRLGRLRGRHRQGADSARRLAVPRLGAPARRRDALCDPARPVAHIQPVVLPERRGGDLSRLAESLAWAIDAHGEQRRKGSNVPYHAHLLGVASLVLNDGGDEDEAVAAVLHDLVEDTDATVEDVRARFGDRVARIVDACSDAYERPKPEWKTRKTAYI